MLKKLLPAFIILFVILISISIMILPTLFTKGVSRVELNKELTLPLILNDTQDIELIFFGYAGCIDICTPRLETLSLFYKELPKSLQKRVNVLFLDISQPLDHTLSQRFSESFHKEFKGIYLKEAILRDYTKAFGVYFSPSLSDSTEFDHTSNLYIVKRTDSKKVLRFVYSAYPYDYEQIRTDIKELIND